MAESNTTNVPVVLQVPTSVKALIEALIFGARESLSSRQIQALYEEQGAGGEEPRKISYEEIARWVEELNSEYSSSDRPYRIIQIAGGYQFATLPLYAEWLGKLYKEQARRKLSQSSIETLAIIAYKQPITKPEIESIRGVNCDYVLSTLLEKDLATIVGRAPTVGRPLLYGTSKEFLRHFGLNDLNDLPRPREIQEILGDSQFETERRMLEAQQGVEEKKEEEFKSRLPHIPRRKAGLDDEVKILPKKRTRDIKVLPEDIEKQGKTEHSGAELAAAEAIQNPTVAPVDFVGSASEAVEPSIDKNVPTIDNIPVVPQLQPESYELPLEPEVSAPIDSVKMPSSDHEPEKTVDEEPPGDQSTSDVHVVVATADIEITSIPVVETDTSEASIQVEEVPLNTKVQNELRISEEPIVEEAQETNLQPIQDVVDVQIPQAIPPIIEEQEVPVTRGDAQAPVDAPLSDSSAPHPKSRWNSWKEKIQGFIKKLFA